MSYTFIKTNRYPYLSPLRYPGGKAILYPLLRDLVKLNCPVGGVYCEPYAGGAGGAMELLFNDDVEEVHLNDKDYHIYCFWDTVLNESGWLTDQVASCDIDMTEWYRQRDVYCNPSAYSRRQIGFSTFFLNRCNRGGILPKAGPIGGFGQKGTYKINARFNRDSLIERLLSVAAQRERINFANLDAVEFMEQQFRHVRSKRLLMYIDPPYYVQGEGLYLNHYKHDDHVTIARLLESRRHRNWILSYDNAPAIRNLYSDLSMLTFDLRYTVQTVALAKEVMVFGDCVEVPPEVRALILRPHNKN